MDSNINKCRIALQKLVDIQVKPAIYDAAMIEALEALSEDIECHWTYDLIGDYYNTSCEEVFEFIDYGGLEENEWEYCPYCGRNISTHGNSNA